MKKKRLGVLFAGMLACLTVSLQANAASGIAIDAATFPDANFRAALRDLEIGADGVLTQAEIDSCTVLSVSDEQIRDMTGVEVFTSLEKLYCERNQVKKIPDLPETLKELWCHNNQLTALPELPSELEMLYCINNQLTSLPELPEKLNSLYCDGNQLTALPELPDAMRWLYCNYNQLTELPYLPAKLLSLRCYENELEYLPALPENLKSLYCYSNQLTALPKLPKGLNWLYCNGNQLTELPELPETLMEIQCGGNRLTSLPELPSNLITLSCTNNQLTSLPKLPKMLVNLWCGQNELTSVELSEEASYEYVDVSGNLIPHTAAVYGNDSVVWGSKDSFGEVKFKYFPQTGSVPIEEVTAIRIKQMPDKTSFDAGDVLDLSGLIIEGTCDDGSVIDLIGYTVTGHRMQVEGRQTLRINYGTRNVSFDITINEGKNMVSTKKITASAGMEDVKYLTENVLDGDPGTIWLTDEKGSKNYNGHWIQFELEEAYYVHGLRYQPRQDFTPDGVITQYQILSSMDGQNWTRVAGGSWSANREWKKVIFPGHLAKYIRLVSEGSVNSMGDVVYTSAAEIRLLGGKEECIHEETVLKNEKAVTYIENGYTGDVVCLNCENIIEAGEIVKKPVCSFADVVKKDFFYKPVMWASFENVTTGVSPTEFAPYNKCTRAQVVTFLYRAAGEPEVVKKDLSFKDVPKDKYYYDAVCWALEEGIVTGFSEERFGPEATCTRGQVVTMLWRMLGKPGFANKNPFEDISQVDYFYEAVLWAYQNKVTTGVSNSRFAPQEPCTRAHVVTFLYRVFGE